MPAPVIPGDDSSNRLLIAVLATVMGAFVVAALVAQRNSAKIGALSDEIVSVSAPSIQRLASTRSVVFELQLALSESLRGGPEVAGHLRTVDACLKSLNDSVQGYLTLPVLQDEGSYWRQIQAARTRFNDAVHRTRDLVQTGASGAAQAEFTRAVEPDGRQLIDAVLSAIDFHAGRSRTFAEEMKSVRARSVALWNFSLAICVAFGILGLLLIRRQTRNFRALVRAHSEFYVARADEFEQFAGRVAHDIRNPLSAARMAAHLALRRAPDGASRDTIERILRALSRADAITAGLLDFARSGGQPDPGARTDVGEALEDFLRGLAPEFERLRIDVQLAPVPPVLVTCSSGVYLSMVGNLVRNAIKYLGPSEPRRVTVQVTDKGPSVRTNVIDTGPGVSADDLPSLFEPYFRVARDRGQDGLGLGLATVKRLAEGHHGSVGVNSEPGKGSTFWFELPRAGMATGLLETASLVPTEEAPHPPDLHH